MQLFEGPDSGAEFSQDKKHRHVLWRIWDKSKPVVMFIGLNPSKATEDDNDKTISKLIRICNHNELGGFYMLNLYTYISTKPEELIDIVAPPIKANLITNKKQSKNEVRRDNK